VRKPFARKHRVRLADGTYRWFYDPALPVEIDGAAKWFAISSDFDGQVRLEESLKRTVQDLRVANKRLERSNLDLQRFALVVAHDLHAPLSTMTAIIYSMLEECGEKLDSQTREYFELLEKSAERMRAILDAVLQYSKTDQPVGKSVASVDCSKLVADTIGDLQSEIRKFGAAITVDPLPILFANEPQLAQVFLNLISNAIQFRRPDVPLRIHVSAREAEHEWTFSVDDNGIGIEAKDRERIFEMFQRVHVEARGTFGIGLGICKNAIDKHGGQIWVESTPGKGSRFSFTLPKFEAAPAGRANSRLDDQRL
jgi:two-component system, chemotaxis family, sensor kinase Cph1